MTIIPDGPEIGLWLQPCPAPPPTVWHDEYGHPVAPRTLAQAQITVWPQVVVLETGEAHDRGCNAVLSKPSMEDRN